MTGLIKKYISLRDAAQYATCSVRFLRSRIADGSLESFLVSGRRFTTTAAVDAMMLRNGNRRPDRGRGIRRGNNEPAVAGRESAKGAAGGQQP
jgi:hypothetical protein